MINTVRTEISIGDVVVLKTDTDKLKRICTGIIVRKNGVSYELSQSDNTSWHYGFEIEFDVNITTIGFAPILKCEKK